MPTELLYLQIRQNWALLEKRIFDRDLLMNQLIKKIFICLTLLLFAVALASVIWNDTSRREPQPAAETPAQDRPSLFLPEETPAPVEEVPATKEELNTPADRVFPQDFFTTLLPAEWFAPCPEKGTVYSVNYPATDVSTGTPISKKMDVYLPYGYSNSHQYDVLILTHGAGSDENYWLSRELTYNGDLVMARDLIDNMIYVGACRQLIVVSCTFRNDVSCNGSVYDVDQLYLEGRQMSDELRNDILPFLAENFSTHAADGSPESLIAAREHFGFAGMSWGAMIGYVFVLPEDLEYISWFGLLSASTMNIRRTISTLNEKTALYPVSYIYDSVGSLDDIRNQAEDLHEGLERYCTGVTEGQNTAMVIIDPARHTFNAWGTCLYNMLLCFFRE